MTRTHRLLAELDGPANALLLRLLSLADIQGADVQRIAFRREADVSKLLVDLSGSEAARITFICNRFSALPGVRSIKASSYQRRTRASGGK